MNRLVRLIIILLGVIVLLVIIASAGAYFVTRQPFPKTTGPLTIDGLNEEVHIYRDEYGIPNIYANNEEDLFFAQGYVTAQDRFWQMEFWRHTGQGRLSEIAGEATVETDKYLRTVGFNRMSERTLDYYRQEQPEYIAILEAYSAGVNAYINDNADNLSLHFEILNLVNEPWIIEPWTPLNSVSWGVAMSHSLGGNMSEEIRRAKLIQDLGEAMVEQIWPTYPYESRPVIAPTEEQVNVLPGAADEVDQTNEETSINWQNVNLNIIGEFPVNALALGSGSHIGSNNWVVAGEHTESGKPILADDTHLPVQIPSIWYEVGLHAPQWHVTGLSFAGVPGVIIGHNDRIAWGVTNADPDVQDLFIEKINPNDTYQYEFEGKWLDMTVIEEVIKVNGGEDVILEVRSTHHGPIISDIRDDLNDVLALQWTQQEPSRILESVILLNQAQNYDEFREALRYWDVPSQNIIYADVDGNIAYQTPGLIPIRKDGTGEVPVPGWTGEYEWQGWIPYEELPALLNPEQGYIVTANHAIVDNKYPHFIAFDWSSGDRGYRINELIAAEISSGGNISLNDLARIQFDNLSLPARSYIPLMEELTSDDPDVQAAIERLRGWDMRETRDSVPSSLFEIFYIYLMYNVLADDIGQENLDTLLSDNAKIIFMHDLANQLNAHWWDDKNTPEEETWEEIVLQSLADGVAWLEDNQGGSMNEWAWGEIHTITFEDAILGASGIAPIEAIFNRGPFAVDSGRDLVNAQNWSNGDPAVVESHASQRMLVDLSNLDNSLSVIPTGNSGHPYNEHYDDQMALYLTGQYHAMPFSREAVEAAAVEHLVLQPQP
jgi:penicillin amidase